LFRAQNYDSVIAFYRDGLELPIVHSWDRGPDQRGTVFQAAAGLIEVIALTAGQRFTPAEGLEVGYEVTDVDAWYQRAQEKGLPIVGELSDKPWGDRSFALLDPLGVRVVVYSIIGKQ